MFSKVLSPATSIVIQFLFFAAKALIPFVTEAQHGLIPPELSSSAGTSSARRGAPALPLLEERGERAFKRMTKAAARYKFHFISLSRRKQLCLSLKSFWKLQYLSLKIKGWKWVFCQVCSSSPLRS